MYEEKEESTGEFRCPVALKSKTHTVRHPLPQNCMETDTYDDLIGTLEFTDKLSSFALPDADLSVHGSAGNIGSVDTESDLCDRIGMSSKLVQLLAVIQPPEIALIVSSSTDRDVLVDGV